MFNLEKHNQIPSESIEGDITGAFDDLEGQYQGEPVESTSDELVDTVDDAHQQLLLQQASNVPIWQYFLDLEQEHPELAPDIQAVKTQSGIQALEDTMNPAAIRALYDQLEKANIEATSTLLNETTDNVFSKSAILNAARKAQNDRIRNVQTPEGLPLSAFNIKQYKKAQMGSSKFPVVNLGDFITKFADDLLSWDGDPRTPESQLAKLAYEEIRNAVSPGFEEEANSILETIIELDPITGHSDAEKSLMKIYDVMLAPMAKNESTQEMSSQITPEMETMEPIMSQNEPKGIVIHDLAEHVTKESSNNNMTKTAADQFGQQYLLYGPTEKRICPKLRGKNLSVGDVVSEYTCRHHCPNGICIDDNKTICGEALWRANAMDKFSREYVDADGNIQGGYFNKRFEINRNVPEENKMRLKPGETRKPRPASQGNLESRMQDMRNKEGQSRDYRPNSDTSKPFNWSKDVDQNNVQQNQTKRDAREKNSGHQLVQYTNRNEGENNPKKLAFNLKAQKTARLSQKPKDLKQTHNPHPADTHTIEVNPSAAHARQPADIDPRKQTLDQGKPMAKKHSFNLKQAKESKTCYEGECWDVNPWAICNKSTGGKSKGKEKFERCVQEVKSKNMPEEDSPKADKEAQFSLIEWTKNQSADSNSKKKT